MKDIMKYYLQLITISVLSLRYLLAVMMTRLTTLYSGFAEIECEIWRYKDTDF